MSWAVLLHPRAQFVCVFFLDVSVRKKISETLPSTWWNDQYSYTWGYRSIKNSKITLCHSMKHNQSYFLNNLKVRLLDLFTDYYVIFRNLTSILVSCQLDSVSWSVLSDSLRSHGLYPAGSCVHGILQARILEWIAIRFSRGSSWPRNQTRVFFISGRFFTIWATICSQIIIFYTCLLSIG